MGVSPATMVTCRPDCDPMARPAPRLSVVMPARNGALTIGAQLDALVRSSDPGVPFEVIVADNGSTDETRRIVDDHRERLDLRIVDASRARGANVARNEGCRSARGDWFVFCDVDDEVDAGWLAAMAAAFAAGHELIGGRIDYRELNDPDTIAWRGADGTGVSKMLGFMPSAHGANLGVSRRAFDSVGGFDEAFLHGGDDVDFCWRVQLAGFELHEVPGSVVHYRLRPSLRAHWRQCTNYGRSEVLLARRFGDRGLRRRPVRAVVGDLWWLVTRLPFAWPLARRGAFVRRLATQWGRIAGAVRWRTPWW
jgi:glycosyltransferase involved in cell wall biosynthesis